MQNKRFLNQLNSIKDYRSWALYRPNTKKVLSYPIWD